MSVHYIHPRVFKINVGFLIAAPSGTIKDSTFDFPEVRISDDVALNFLRGNMRLSQTKEGILVQAQLTAGTNAECRRCLDPVAQESEVVIEELFATKAETPAAFHIGDDGILDLAPLLREELLINDEQERVLCREDCQGLCPQCGENRNRVQCTCDEDAIDPRLAALKDLLKSDR